MAIVGKEWPQAGDSTPAVPKTAGAATEPGPGGAWLSGGAGAARRAAKPGIGRASACNCGEGCHVGWYEGCISGCHARDARAQHNAASSAVA